MREEIQHLSEDRSVVRRSYAPPYKNRRTQGAAQVQAPADDQMVRALGWFSMGLGLTAILAPRPLSRLIGIAQDHDALVRLMGLREVASGLGILRQENQAPWMWSRVAGDIIDLSLLTAAMSSGASDRRRLSAATAAVAGVTLLDMRCARRMGRPSGEETGHVAQRSASITIKRPVEEVYRFWRDFENLPRFMFHLESVTVRDDRRSHWVARGPAGKTVQWDAELTDDRPGERIAWQSIEGAMVDNAGEVVFKKAPGDRGTEVHVRLAYDPPGGSLGTGIAKLLGADPGQQIKGDLYRFKQVMETGEVLHSDASIHRRMHPAQPSGRAPGRTTLIGTKEGI